ncbi:unnamed protein product [Ectocarpus sp. CCAP 1310/34]|nr:unnamed protein product [Ectocarpus sp. CCAP 1310/34]
MNLKPIRSTTTYVGLISTVIYIVKVSPLQLTNDNPDGILYAFVSLLKYYCVDVRL